MSSNILPLVAEVTQAATTRRLDWHLVNRAVRLPPIQELLGDGSKRAALYQRSRGDVGFDLQGFQVLNLDGLVQLICVCESLNRAGFPPILILPPSADQQNSLAVNGFIRAARNVSRLQGPRLCEWDVREDAHFTLGKPYITRFTSASELTRVQDWLDRFLVSPSLHRILGIDRSSEDGFEWAPSLAHAVAEVLKNILEWSGNASGIVAMESIPGTLVRLVVADSGIGVERSLERQRSPVLGLEPLKFALLYRYFFGERPGLFTVLETTKRWGGEFVIRSASSQFDLTLPAGSVAAADLMQFIAEGEPRKVAFLPGLQLRVDFHIPRQFRRRR